jgi:hypothetical protein
MRKKNIPLILIVCFSLLCTKTYAQASESDRIRADAASAGSSHAISISMIFWGVLLVAGIAVAAILIETSTGHTD